MNYPNLLTMANCDYAKHEDLTDNTDIILFTDDGSVSSYLINGGQQAQQVHVYLREHNGSAHDEAVSVVVARCSALGGIPMVS